MIPSINNTKSINTLNSAATSKMAYWGDLPLSRQNSVRRTSLDKKLEHPQQEDPQARPNRISTQSQAATVSTQDSFVSPTASSFKGDGLAPRPPLFPYGAAGSYSQDYQDKRRRRASRETEEYFRDTENTVPPPAAPDAPRPPPPVSYKQPYSNTGPPTSYYPPVRLRSNRQPDSQVDATPPGSSESYRDGRVEAKASRSGVERGDLNINTDYRRDRRDRNSVGGEPDRPKDNPDKGVIRRGTVDARRERPEYHDPTPPARSGQASAAEIEAQRRREWAPDRSPLQRLELTLDSITKEEKRARAEEAELLAREARAGRGGDRLNQNSVRFKNRPIAKTDATAQTEPHSLPEAGLVRGLSNKQKDELQRSGTIETKKPMPTESASVRQLGKGFEYQPQQETASTTREPEKSSAPQRGPSFRERATAPTAAAAGAVAGAALSRSTSNKLKKDPPGDPWFHQRIEAERAYPEVTPRRPSADARQNPDTMTRGSLGSVPGATISGKALEETRNEGSENRTTTHRPAAAVDPDFDEDFPQPAPVRRNPSKKIKQLALQKLNNEVPQPISPQQQQLYVDRLDRSEELAPEASQRGGTSQEHAEIATVNGIKYAVAPEVVAGNFGQERAARGSDGHHHLPNIAHHRRSQYQPGDGLYVPHRPLEEWKNGSIGALTGALLDLDMRQTEAEKDKAWWEAGHSGKRRASANRRPKIETYDGENENSNGMAFPNFQAQTRRTICPLCQCWCSDMVEDSRPGRSSCPTYHRLQRKHQGRSTSPKIVLVGGEGATACTIEAEIWCSRFH